MVEPAEPGRRQWTTPGDYEAYCDTCDWRNQARNALGSGAQHAKRYGHYVSVRIERTVVFDMRGSKEAPRGH